MEACNLAVPSFCVLSKPLPSQTVLAAYHSPLFCICTQLCGTVGGLNLLLLKAYVFVRSVQV